MRVLTCLSLVLLLCAGCQKKTLRAVTPASPPQPMVEDRVPEVPPQPQPEKTRRKPAPQIGVLVPLSGRYAPYGREYLNGVMLATEEFAAAGPARVDIVPADSKGEPLAALAAVRRLIDAEPLVGILGSVLSMPTIAAAIEANGRGVPMLSNVATEDGIGGIGPFVFHEVRSLQSTARATAEFSAFELRRFRVAIVSAENGEGRAMAAAFSERILELGGEVAFSETFPAGTTDFSPLARRIAASEPQAVYVPMNADELVLLIPALGARSVQATLLGGEDLGAESVLQSAGVDLEGAVVPSVESSDAMSRARFAELYRARFGANENRFAEAGYAGARRVLDVVAQQPNLGRKDLQRGLAARFEAERAAPPRLRFRVVRSGELRDFDAP